MSKSGVEELAVSRPIFHLHEGLARRLEVDFDRSKTLVQLKREKFRDLAWDFHRFPSGFYLRNVPLEQLTGTDMWVLIRQAIGLDYLVILALERLEVNPLLRCRHAEGDLLSAVLCA